MKKTTKQERVKLQAIISVACIAIIAMTTIFLSGCLKYWDTVRAIDAVEREAWSDRTWNAGEWIPGWTDELTAEYNSAVAAKENLASSNDVARWCYHSGYSVTGQLLRVVTIFVAAALWMLSIVIIVLMIVANIKATRHKKNYIERQHGRATTYVR